MDIRLTVNYSCYNSGEIASFEGKEAEYILDSGFGEVVIPVETEAPVVPPAKPDPPPTKKEKKEHPKKPHRKKKRFNFRIR